MPKVHSELKVLKVTVVRVLPQSRVIKEWVQPAHRVSEVRMVLVVPKVRLVHFKVLAVPKVTCLPKVSKVLSAHKVPKVESVPLVSSFKVHLVVLYPVTLVPTTGLQ